VTLHRCFAWNARARQREPDGPLWFPHPFQGDGRYDNPDRYGCLYLADRPVAALVCCSWMFNTQLERILPPSANLVRYLRDLYLFPLPPSDTGGLWFLFLQTPFMSAGRQNVPRRGGSR